MRVYIPQSWDSYACSLVPQYGPRSCFLCLTFPYSHVQLQQFAC